MMYSKAIYFHDIRSYTRILESLGPKEQKKMGRAVAGFSDESWKLVREDVAEMGNWCKLNKTRD